MKRIARQPLHTIIEIIKKRLAHIYMYHIVQHVIGTSNAIARGSNGVLKSYEIQQAFDYDWFDWHED